MRLSVRRLGFSQSELHERVYECLVPLVPNSHEDLPERMTMGGYPVPIEWAVVWECPECGKARAERERRAMIP